jgi:prophage antirepressor-like protein
MESNVQIFDYDSKQIRMLTIEGDPWFVAKDVCSYFGDSNYRRSISRIGDDVKGVSQINTPGGSQNMVIINEPGLYELLFSFQPEKARSKDYAPQIESHIEERIKKIKAFKKWVTSVVLPQIRKTGSYSKPKSLEEISLLAITGLTAKIEEQKQALT